jgi:hypothetical protein
MEIIYTDKDGTTVKFTEEMAIAAITERDALRVSLNDCQDRSTRYYGKLVTAREHVFEFFNSRYDSNSEQIECDVDDVNELLENIGTEKLKKLWTVTGTVNFTVTNIPASNEEEANDYVMEELSVELDGDAHLDEWTVEVSDTEQQ